MTETIERNTKKFDICKEANDYRAVYGTFNRKNPQSIFLTYNTWAFPKKAGFKDCVSVMERCLKVAVAEEAMQNGFTKSLCVTEVSTVKMAIGRKTYVTVEAHLRQGADAYPITSPTLKNVMVTLAQRVNNVITETCGDAIDFQR